MLGGRLGLEIMVTRLCSDPARIMGLYPRRRVIQVGAGADLAIIHPSDQLTARHQELETATDWSPYQDWYLAGFARTTISRGEVIVDGCRLAGSAGRGSVLPRSPSGTR